MFSVQCITLVCDVHCVMFIFKCIIGHWCVMFIVTDSDLSTNGAWTHPAARLYICLYIVQFRIYTLYSFEYTHYTVCILYTLYSVNSVSGMTPVAWLTYSYLGWPGGCLRLNQPNIFCIPCSCWLCLQCPWAPASIFFCSILYLVHFDVCLKMLFLLFSLERATHNNDAIWMLVGICVYWWSGYWWLYTSDKR